MRKALAYLFCCGVVVVAAACAGVDAPTDPLATDRPQLSDPAFARRAVADAPGIARRLDRVSHLLARANHRLDRINADLTPPPDPDKPAILAALASIRSEAQHLLATVAEIEEKTQRP